MALITINVLISVITVVYNAAETLEDTIKSVLRQRNASYEYIIIDGGSTDGTIEIIDKYKDNLACFISEKDNGIYDAMNKALRYASGDRVYFLGADDVFFNDDVLGDLNLIVKDPNKIYYGNVLFKASGRIYDGKFNAFKLVTRNISHQSIVYPKDVFNSFIFNTRYKIFADYALNLKLYNHPDFSFEYTPLTIAIFDESGTSGTNTPDMDFEADRIRIIKDNFSLYVYLYRYVRTIVASALANR